MPWSLTRGAWPATPFRTRRTHARGLSLVELLVALVITAVLLTATMIAIDASFRAYASAAQTASTQTATRMVVNRLLTLIRTSTTHGPLQPDANPTWPVVVSSSDNDTMKSGYIELIDTTGLYLRVEYRIADQELWALVDDNGNLNFDAGETTAPLLGGVTAATFFMHRRIDSNGVLVLERGSIDLTVETDVDNTFSIEGNAAPIRVIASTMPRKLN